jgi:DNA-binding MarR family transcriptional regulator
MTIDEAVATVQLTYPQVYHTCHTRHQRKRSTEHALSARDAAILAHCSVDAPIVPARLARHLSVAASTLSEAIKKLTQTGFVRRVAVDDDRRQLGILLTPKGVRAVRETSVLESARLMAVLKEVTPAERAVITAGLMKLAEACRRFSEKSSSTRTGGSVS